MSIKLISLIDKKLLPVRTQVIKQVSDVPFKIGTCAVIRRPRWEAYRGLSNRELQVGCIVHTIK